MIKPRSAQISIDDTPFYHCMVRCVRCAICVVMTMKLVRILIIANNG
ncbi:hypothetical protein [Sessilibacter corallicola]|nr:hypothetical protein [Sessilibacter corallicola]MCE2028656.1 hypothetical protein [Sessilibacter corallicola]